MLAAPDRNQERTAPIAEPRRVSFNEVRARIEVIRAQEEVRYERSRAECAGLQRVAQPAALDDQLAVEQKRIQEQVANATEFTGAERARLVQLAQEKRSWNPPARAVATRLQEELRHARRSRYDSAVAKAMREFEQRAVPQITKRVAAEERRYLHLPPRHFTLKGKCVTRARPFATVYPRWSIGCRFLNALGFRSLRTAISMRISRSFQPPSIVSIRSCQRQHGVTSSIESAASGVTALVRENRSRWGADSARLDLYLCDRQGVLRTPAYRAVCLNVTYGGAIPRNCSRSECSKRCADDRKLANYLRLERSFAAGAGDTVRYQSLSLGALLPV